MKRLPPPSNSAMLPRTMPEAVRQPSAAALLSGGTVDMHCHLAGIGAGGSGCFISPRMRRNWRFNPYLRSFGVTRRELEQHGDQLVAARVSAALAQSRWVRAAVVLAMDGVVGADGRLDPERTEFFVPDEFIADMVARHPNLRFGASVNPRRPDALERLEQAHARGAVLVKWLPNIMGIDPADRRWLPFYEKLAELRLPLLSHTGPEHSFSWADETLGDPEKLRLPLSVGVTVIAAHASSSGKYHGESGANRLARLMGEFPKLYADISALTLINNLGHLHRAVRRPEFAGRLVYGSDFPLIQTALVSPWYAVRLPLRERLAIARERNPWDRDVLLKRGLGAAPDLFAASERMFGGGINF